MEECWSIFDNIIGKSERVLLYGIPGTGKTYQAVKSNVPDNKNVYSTTLTVDSSASELIGHGVKAFSTEFIDGTKDPNRGGRPRLDLVIRHSNNSYWRLRPCFYAEN